MEATDYFVGGYYGGSVGTTKPELPTEIRNSDQKCAGGENFTVDDLLDFSNDDVIMSDEFFDSVAAANSTDSSTVTAVDSCNSSLSGYGENRFSSSTASFGQRSFVGDSQFSSELCVPYAEVAELEWLSNFVEDSFSAEHNLQNNLHIISGSKPPTPQSSSSTRPDSVTLRNPNNQFLRHETPLPGKARSKRPRAAPCDWSTRLLHLSTAKTSPSKKRENTDTDTAGRKCLHCASEKTPQWRTGPMGPKTLCNACGVRFKSGRLVPEYRPAASPTFVSAKHSNSHRKVLELRRQREMQRHHHQQQHQFIGHSSIYGGGGGGGDHEFMIHHHSAPPEFRQVM